MKINQKREGDSVCVSISYCPFHVTLTLINNPLTNNSTTCHRDAHLKPLLN